MISVALPARTARRTRASRSARTSSRSLPESGGPAVHSLRAAKLPAPAAPPLPRRAEGPLQAFERLAKSGDAATLEAFARYLVLTQSDDSTAARGSWAASTSPAIERLLLAGELAPRAQPARLVDRKSRGARDPARDRRQEDGSLLARAARTRWPGRNWRDAVPYYDRALERDPSVTLARFELYTEAGLREEPARTFLDTQLAKRPKASPSCGRWSARRERPDDRSRRDGAALRGLRFDDPSFDRPRGSELATARRDAASANRWIDRLLAANPNSCRGAQHRAHAYLSSAIAPRRRDMPPRARSRPGRHGDDASSAAAYALGGLHPSLAQIDAGPSPAQAAGQGRVRGEYVAHNEPSKKARPTKCTPARRAAFSRGAALPTRPKPGTLEDSARHDGVPTTSGEPLSPDRVQPRALQCFTINNAIRNQLLKPHFNDVILLHLPCTEKRREDRQEPSRAASAADNPSISTYTSARAPYCSAQPTRRRRRRSFTASRTSRTSPSPSYFGEVTYMQSNSEAARARRRAHRPEEHRLLQQARQLRLTSSIEETEDTHALRSTRATSRLSPPSRSRRRGARLGHVHVSTGHRSWDDMGRWYWGLVKTNSSPTTKCDGASPT